MVAVSIQQAAMADLMAAEADFLHAMLWQPLAPEFAGAPVLWRSPSGLDVRKQDEAVTLAKSEWVQLYAR